jgi:hypothetical protein
MKTLWIVLGVGAVGGGLLYWKLSSRASNTAGTTLHATPGNTYRLTIVAPTAAAASASAQSLGFLPHVTLPTFTGSFTVLADYGAPSKTFSPQELLSAHVSSLVQTEAPPPQTLLEHPMLDSGMPADLLQAVAYAMVNEKDPKTMNDFGNALLPEYPIAGSLLISSSRAKQVSV